MLGTATSASLLGLNAELIKVEIDISNGLPGWIMVGLPEKVVQEAKERVTAAIRNSGITIEPRKTTINLSPATYKKRGTHYDLPIAIALLMAHQILPQSVGENNMFVGELSLTGDLKNITGSFLFAHLAQRKNLKQIVLPTINAKEASLIKSVETIGCHNLVEVITFLQENKKPIANFSEGSKPDVAATFLPAGVALDYVDIKGQLFAKRAVEIAAAGGHHLIMLGSPGAGKTMLASRIPSILPPLTDQQSIETTKIYSAFGMNNPESPLITMPPFRNPHHSISYAGLIGGGKELTQPGEMTLAHNGVLFLDELPEFHRDALQMLRQPLEMHHLYLSRAQWRMKLPAKFLFIAAMNPCKCGYLGHPKRSCTCAPAHAFQYQRKISGPLLDRIDIQIEVPPLSEHDLFDAPPGEPSEKIRERVLRARHIQQTRYEKLQMLNAHLSPKQVKQFCLLQPEAQTFFRKAFPALHLSARAHDRILRVARTIADLTEKEMITTEHIAEAIQYRLLDREKF